MTRPRRVVIADLLTTGRLGIAVAIVPAAWSLHLALTSTLLSAAWLTDVADGRLARSAGTEGRMGRWDLMADTAVGTALLAGLVGAGQIPPLPAAGILLIFGAWFYRGNVAASMLLQLSGYLPFMWLLWKERPMGWWLPPVTAAVIGLLDWRRLIWVNIPAFIRGITGQSQPETGAR